MITKELKGTKAITLIAMVISILVLLIFAGISLALVVGETGITQRAVNARKTYDIAGAKEKLELQIAGYAGDFYQDKYVNGSIGASETVGSYVLGKFTNGSDFERDYILTKDGNKITITNKKDVSQKATATIDEKGKVTWDEIGYESEPVVNETHIAKSTEKTESYVGYYADIDNDGEVDGIIYADMLVGNTKSGRWNNDDWSDYNIPKIADTTSVKDYVVSTKTYAGQTTVGKYKANEIWGEKDVLVPATNSTGNKDRFYIMTLEDFTSNSKNKFYWYKNALGKLDRHVDSSAIDFGEGKQNTIDMLNDWNNNTATYGEQTTDGEDDYIDLWGAIQDGQYSLVQTENDSKKWFVPSKSEWSAFGEELGITTSDYITCGLSVFYWSSSQDDRGALYDIHFDMCYVDNDGGADQTLGVRLSATF